MISSFVSRLEITQMEICAPSSITGQRINLIGTSIPPKSPPLNTLKRAPLALIPSVERFHAHILGKLSFGCNSFFIDSILFLFFANAFLLLIYFLIFHSALTLVIIYCSFIELKWWLGDGCYQYKIIALSPVSLFRTA